MYIYICIYIYIYIYMYIYVNKKPVRGVRMCCTVTIKQKTQSLFDKFLCSSIT